MFAVIIHRNGKWKKIVSVYLWYCDSWRLKGRHKQNLLKTIVVLVLRFVLQLNSFSENILNQYFFFLFKWRKSSRPFMDRGGLKIECLLFFQRTAVQFLTLTQGSSNLAMKLQIQKIQCFLWPSWALLLMCICTYTHN